MKKIKKIFLCVIFSLLFCNYCFAVGTVTVTLETYGVIKTVLIEWVADASDGSIPDAVLSGDYLAYIKGYHCYLAETDPGSPAPTDDYDIVVNNDFSVDIFGGRLADRDTANSEQTTPDINTALGGRTIVTAITVSFSGNTVNSATGKLRLYFSN
jgi:hypothetical protein